MQARKLNSFLSARRSRPIVKSLEPAHVIRLSPLNHDKPTMTSGYFSSSHLTDTGFIFQSGLIRRSTASQVPGNNASQACGIRHGRTLRGQASSAETLTGRAANRSVVQSVIVLAFWATAAGLRSLRQTCAVPRPVSGIVARNISGGYPHLSRTLRERRAHLARTRPKAIASKVSGTGGTRG